MPEDILECTDVMFLRPEQTSVPTLLYGNKVLISYLCNVTNYLNIVIVNFLMYTKEYAVSSLQAHQWLQLNYNLMHYLAYVCIYIFQR